MRFLILHGPNLNRLGKREPEVYGRTTLAQVDEEIRAHARTLGVSTRHLQSNSEGALIDALHAAEQDCAGVVFNPGAYTHYAWALRDAVTSIPVPVVEVHLSNVHAREAWRQVSVLEGVVLEQVAGRGIGSYLHGLTLLVAHLKGAS